jgi:prepilin-type N-terminal cleavage/methylation domain-containing protein
MNVSRAPQGFSLIELLVVVAIIGILAAVGIVGYQGYITATQDEASKANLNTISRAIEQDNLSITENLGGATDLNANITTASNCLQQVDSIIKQVNDVDGGRNPFRENCYRVFNGNRLLSNYSSAASVNMTTWGLTSTGTSPSVSACGFEAPVVVASAARYVKVPRGAIMLACNSSSALVGASDYKLYSCACTGQDGCTTTDIDFYSESDANNPGCVGASDVASCKKNYMRNNPTKCPTPGN